MMVKLNVCIFLIEDDDLLKKYYDILNKVCNSINKEFESEPTFNQILRQFN